MSELSIFLLLICNFICFVFTAVEFITSHFVVRVLLFLYTGLIARLTLLYRATINIGEKHVIISIQK